MGSMAFSDSTERIAHPVDHPTERPGGLPPVTLGGAGYTTLSACMRGQASASLTAS
jgi:hypothetical protein